MNFVEHIFNGKYPVLVPDFEVPDLQTEIHAGRLDSMHELLKLGDIYLDIGTEMGWFAPIFARLVGAENMCLFEPSEAAWPNIRATWKENGLATPKATYWGFLGSLRGVRPEDKRNWYKERHFKGIPTQEIYGKMREWDTVNGWPAVAYASNLVQKPAYRCLIECPYHRATTLDAWVEDTGIVPRALGMNIEGAEAMVLEGGQEVFKKYHPLVWVGMHANNGALANGYGATQEELVQLMARCGYKAKFLEMSYEHWWLFQ